MKENQKVKDKPERKRNVSVSVVILEGLCECRVGQISLLSEGISQLHGLTWCCSILHYSPYSTSG